MSDDLEDRIDATEKKGGFAFGLMIFGLFVIIPLAISAGIAYNMKNNQDLRLECLKQSKTYVNDMCLPIIK